MIYISVIVIGVLLFLGGCTFMQQSRFGSEPQGERLEQISRSPNYTNSMFHNQIETPVLKEGESKLSIIVSNIFSSAQNLRPSHVLPSTKTDIKALPREKDVIIWLGHSSFYVQLSGKRILVDPVFSPYASPVSFAITAFDGTSLYTSADFPDIDLLLITHDHWDHLDYDTATALQSKVDKIFVPLGIGAHFEKWGYSADQINESDWYGSLTLDDTLTIHCVPARHYSGRGFGNNKTLWSGFVLESDNKRVLLGGDSGYGPHFQEIGEKFGEFDLVALDMGQYDPRWPYIHMTPDEAAQASLDLNAKALLPAHVGRFTLAQHDWREPFNRIAALSSDKPYQLFTPLIGEATEFSDLLQTPSKQWWNDKPNH